MRTQGVAFIPIIGVEGNALFIDGIGLLIIVLLTWFSAVGDIMDCEVIEWGAFDVIDVSIGL